jgi:TDG/mug DNA glycosylase family protein
LSGLPDYLEKKLKVIFIGFNPSTQSGERGHHFANPTNRFWKILELSGLLPRRFTPEEDFKLLDYGYGLTNIVARPTKAAADLTKEEYEEGRSILLEKLARFQPAIACYVGKGVYEKMSPAKTIPWGKQEVSMLPSTIDFVAPSSSGLVRMPLDEMVSIYNDLKGLVDLKTDHES